MAAYGTQYMRFAPMIMPEPETSMPTYGVQVSMGPLVTGNETVTLATADNYGDNVLQNKFNEVASAAIPAEVTQCPKASLALVYGAHLDPKTQVISYGAGDTAPFGGLALIRNLEDKSGKKTFEANFYTKAQAALGNVNAQTKGSSITYQNTTINFTAFPPLWPEGKWKYTAEFDTFNEAVAFIDEMFGGAAPPASQLTGAIITGTATVGSTLGVDLVYSATPMSTPSLTYVWQSSDDDVAYTDIAGANSATYVVQSGDEDAYIRCVVSASGSATGTATSPGVLATV